jgi:NTP pyrophosphatase (non-canonical NTP hydrolase)
MEQYMADLSDKHTTIADLKTDVEEFISQRKWEQYHDPKSVAMSIAIEAAELLEPFQWLEASESWGQVNDPAQCDVVAEELADVLIYCLSFANLADIDISSAVRSKLAKNRKRFPIQPEGNPPG